MPSSRKLQLPQVLEFRPEEGVIRLHEQRVEGIVRGEIDKVEHDPANGRFAAGITWHQSFEAEQHLHHYGRSSSPVCWSLVGYVSGFASARARGAFTGAVRDKPGLFEVASAGTLFLDEVGEIGPALQASC